MSPRLSVPAPVIFAAPEVKPEADRSVHREAVKALRILPACQFKLLVFKFAIGHYDRGAPPFSAIAPLPPGGSVTFSDFCNYFHSA